MKKTIILSALAFSLISAASTSSVYAESSNSNQMTLIQKIAQKFGLNQTEVEGVFTEVRTERQQQRQVAYEGMLSSAAAEGKITEAQKNLLIVKHKELMSQRDQQRDSWQSMDRADRHEYMQNKKAELEKWASDNGIDPKYLFGGLGFRGRYKMM